MSDGVEFTGMKSGARAMRNVASNTSAVSAQQSPTILIVDDDRLMLGALSSLFRSAGLSVQTFASPIDLLEHPWPSTPSCLVLDVMLPQLSGFEVQRELSRLGSKIPVVFITGHGDIPMSVSAMKAGAIDFLTKPFRDREILDAVRKALDRDRDRRNEERRAAELRSRFESLTKREGQVMSLVTAGLTNKQVGREISISERTVKIHRGRVMRKMRTESLADLVLIAETLGVRANRRKTST
jgi:FixJ family two-component response regulator